MKDRKDIQLIVGSSSEAEAIARIGREAFSRAFMNQRNKIEVAQYLQRSFSKQAILGLMSREESTFIVAKENDAVIGFSQLIDRAPSGIREGKWLMMDRLYLDPDRIGTGIGRMLLEHSITHAKEKKADWLWLMVLRSNTKASSFYRAFGMELFGESPGKFEADAEMDDWMRLRL